MRTLGPARLVALALTLAPALAAADDSHPFEIGARVGGYGFHREGESNPTQTWSECRMNGLGVFGTRALTGPLFVEAGLDLYASTNTGQPGDMPIDRTSGLVSAAIGARTQVTSWLRGYLQLGAGVELARVSVPYGDERIRDAKAMPEGFFGLGIDLRVARGTFIGSSFRTLVMGNFDYDPARLDMSNGWVAAPSSREVFDASPDVANQVQFYLRREILMRALVLIVVTACAAEPAGPETSWQWDLPAQFPVPRVPADNPMTAAKVELGRHLFFDTRLSGNGTQACASCHDPARAFSDGNVTPLGATGERGIHNAMSLVNVAYNSSSTWAHDVRRLEDQARLPMFGTTPVEMGLGGSEAEALARLAAEPIYGELFDAAFPADARPIAIDNVTRALASFERTILSGDSPFDRFVAGDAAALDASEQRGLALFESARLGCTHCHSGFNLASAYDHVGMAAGGQVQLFNTGLYDVDGSGAYPAGDRGLVEVTGLPGDMGRFRAPTLRNISLTAPYFHDGSARTLDDVIDHYASGGVPSPLKSPFITGFALTAGERADLRAFLGSLTDPSLTALDRWKP